MIQQSNPTKDYHACRTHVSRGMLFDLYTRPRLFEGRYITGTIPLLASTAAMGIGTAVHAMALEGRSLLVSCPTEHLSSDGAMRTKAAKEWRAEAEASGYIVTGADTTNRVERTAASVVEMLATLGEPQKYGVVEKPIYWEHATGTCCRCMPDILTPGGIIDLKTTDELNPRKIASTIWELGYWLQAAHYLEGGSNAIGHRITKFIFVFAETNPPYRCWIRELEPDYIAWACERRERLIEELNRRTETNDWADEGESELLSISKPRWAE